MYQTLEMLLVLILAGYGVLRLVQDVMAAFRTRPGPPVSMLVVLRNREQDVEYLMRRLASWRKHQWVELDLVVVDDSSDDDTGLILRGLQQKIPFRLVALEPTVEGAGSGADQAMMTGLLHCHNALVWLVDFRKAPRGILSERVFRVFFCQGWR